MFRHIYCRPLLSAPVANRAPRGVRQKCGTGTIAWLHLVFSFDLRGSAINAAYLVGECTKPGPTVFIRPESFAG